MTPTLLRKRLQVKADHVDRVLADWAAEKPKKTLALLLSKLLRSKVVAQRGRRTGSAGRRIQQRPMHDDKLSLRPARRVVMQPEDPTRVLPVVDEAALFPRRDTKKLAQVLLPQEVPVLSSSPHPIVLIRPATGVALGLVALVAVVVTQHIGAHHRTAPLIATILAYAALALAGAFTLTQLAQLFKALAYYFGFRVIATNRRVFVVHSLLHRSIRPLGNSEMARSSLKQSILGRIFDFGTIHAGDDTLRDMRFPMALWRSLEAVAHGVENGEWKPSTRSTLIT